MTNEKNANLSDITLNGKPLESVIDEVDTPPSDEEVVRKEDQQKPRRYHKPRARTTTVKDRSGKVRELTTREINEEYVLEDVRALILQRAQGVPITIPEILTRVALGTEVRASWLHLFKIAANYAEQDPCKTSSWSGCISGRLMKSPMRYLFKSYKAEKGKGSQWSLYYDARGFSVEELLPLWSVGKVGESNTLAFLKKHKEMSRYFYGMLGDKDIIAHILEENHESATIEEEAEDISHEIKSEDDGISFDDAIQALKKYAQQYEIEMSINMKLYGGK